MLLAQTLVTVNEWVVVGGGIASLILSIILFFFKIGRVSGKMEEGFKKHGERIGVVELDVRGNETSIDDLRRIDQQHEFKMLELSKSMGVVEGSISRLVESWERTNERRSSEDMDIVDRLARIEERLDVFIKLHIGKGAENG